MNSVVFGTSANKVTPRNFSSMPEPSRMTSTTSTKISVHKILSAQHIPRKITTRKHVPAMIAYNAVHANSTLALVARLHEGPS